MLGVKLARHATGRDLVVKFEGAYHGSYDDLEAGLYGIGELEGRTLLAEFGEPRLVPERDRASRRRDRGDRDRADPLHVQGDRRRRRASCSS